MVKASVIRRPLPHHDPHPELMQGRKALRCHLSNIVPVQVSGCAQASVQEQCRHPGLIREDRYGSLGSLRELVTHLSCCGRRARSCVPLRGRLALGGREDLGWIDEGLLTLEPLP